jgi:hypothetical protein
MWNFLVIYRQRFRLQVVQLRKCLVQQMLILDCFLPDWVPKAVTLTGSSLTALNVLS